MRVPVEAQSKPAHALSSKIPHNIAGLFVEPVLLKGEDPKLYWNLVSAMIDEHRPEGLLDWISLNDLITKLWEERTLRHASNAIVRFGQRNVVKKFLAEVLPGDDRLKQPNMADREANKYFSTDKKESGRIRSELDKYGVTEAGLLAQSAQDNRDAIMMFEKMRSSRERSRQKLQKEMRRRQSSQEEKSAPSVANPHHRGSERLQGSCQEEEVAASAKISKVSTASTSERVGPDHDQNRFGSYQGMKSESPDADQRSLDGLGSCQEIELEMDRDGDQNHVDLSTSYHELTIRMNGASDAHPNGH